MAAPAYRVQALPNSDIVPRWRHFDSRAEAFDAARQYLPHREGWHHVQVLNHHGECVWDVLSEPEPPAAPPRPQPKPRPDGGRTWA